jgi:3-oxoacyl-[acyl-carrier protein] reductase
MAALAPVKGLSLYSASKFGARGFALAAAMDLKPQGVDVTVICPDAVDTPMLEAEARMPDAALVFTSKHPLTVHDMERLMLRRVLPRRPLEVSLPLRMGLLTRLAGAWPGLLGPLGPLFWKSGARHQQAYLRDARGRERSG